MDELLEKLGYYNFILSYGEEWIPTTMIIKKLKNEKVKLTNEIVNSRSTVRSRILRRTAEGQFNDIRYNWSLMGSAESNVARILDPDTGNFANNEYYKYSNKSDEVVNENTICLKNNKLNLIAYKKISSDNKDNGFIISKIKDQVFTRLSLKTEELIKAFSFVKIKNFEVSSMLFGHISIKKQMFESKQFFNIAKLYPNYECKDGVIRDVMEIQSPIGKNLKFVLDELDVTFLDVNKITKGFKSPLDRTIRKESKIKVYKKNNANLAYGTTAKVLHLIRAGNIKYAKILTKDNKEYMIPTNKIKVTA